MANAARGEVELQLGSGTYTVALGLGVLAELEDAFGVDSFEEALNTVFQGKMSAKRLEKFIHALLVGNGIEITDKVKKDVRAIQPTELVNISNALMKMMNNSGLAKEGDEEGADAPLSPGENAGDSG